MSAVRVESFSVENLFARFKLNSDVDPEKAVKNGWDMNKTYFTISTRTRSNAGGR